MANAFFAKVQLRCAACGMKTKWTARNVKWHCIISVMPYSTVSWKCPGLNHLSEMIIYTCWKKRCIFPSSPLLILHTFTSNQKRLVANLDNFRFHNYFATYWWLYYMTILNILLYYTFHCVFYLFQGKAVTETYQRMPKIVLETFVAYV